MQLKNVTPPPRPSSSTDWRADSFKIIGGYLDGTKEYSTKFYKGQAPPRGPTPYTLFYTIFDRQDSPLVCIPSVEK